MQQNGIVFVFSRLRDVTYYLHYNCIYVQRYVVYARMRCLRSWQLAVKADMGLCFELGGKHEYTNSMWNGMTIAIIIVGVLNPPQKVNHY